jgi:hypothetical protein
MDATFRMARRYRIQGVLGIPFYLAFWAVGTYALLTDSIYRHSRLALLLFAGYTWLMAGLCLWLLLACRRHMLTIRRDGVISQGVVRRREINPSDVVAARWKTQGASLVLKCASSKLTIRFANYQREERDRLVRHLRAVLPLEVQTGWNLFAYTISPGEPTPLRAKPGPYEILVLRDRWDSWLLSGTLAAFLLGLIACWVTGEERFLIGLLVPLAGWAVLHASTPRDGMVMRRLSLNSGPFLVFLLVWCVLGISGLLLLELLRPKLAASDTAVFAFLVTWGLVLCIEVARQDRRGSRRDREEAELAAKARREALTDPWRTP